MPVKPITYWKLSVNVNVDVYSIDLLVGATYFLYYYPTIERRWIWRPSGANSNRYCFILHIEAICVYIERYWIGELEPLQSILTQQTASESIANELYECKKPMRFSRLTSSEQNGEWQFLRNSVWAACEYPTHILN